MTNHPRHCVGGNNAVPRKTAAPVQSVNLSALARLLAEIRKHELQPLCRPAADQKIIFMKNALADGLVKLHAADGNQPVDNNPFIRQHRKLRALRTQVDNHGSLRVMERDADSNSIRYGLFHQKNT